MRGRINVVSARASRLMKHQWPREAISPAVCLEARCIQRFVRRIRRAILVRVLSKQKKKDEGKRKKKGTVSDITSCSTGALALTSQTESCQW